MSKLDTTLADFLPTLAGGATLSREESRRAFRAMTGGPCLETHVASFLTALAVRGETVDELAGGAEALLEHVEPRTPFDGLDTCGTGGDGAGLFNVSTATAIVVSACGVPVAKHGNRAVSSSTGSADVLEALGVDVEADPARAEECLAEFGLGFFFAPLWHGALKDVAMVRRRLGFRTAFNLLGPLCNPLRATHQLLGVARQSLVDRIAETLQVLGRSSATVVWGADGLDEVTLAAETHVVCLHNGDRTRAVWTPSMFGLAHCAMDGLRVAGPVESAQMIRRILAGAPGPARDIVLANASAALFTAGRTDNLRAGTLQAAEAIDSGRAAGQLEKLVARTSAKGKP